MCIDDEEEVVFVVVESSSNCGFPTSSDEIAMERSNISSSSDPGTTNIDEARSKKAESGGAGGATEGADGGVDIIRQPVRAQEGV